jgi:ParB family chromosome partitioning protein
VYCIEHDEHFGVVKKAAESLRALDGPDSLEPDYVLLRARWSTVEPALLDRLREKGDAARIMQELPKIQAEDDLLEPLVAILLARDPLPVDAAGEQLGTEHEVVGTVAATLVGRSGKGAAKKHGKALIAAVSKAAEAWNRKRKELEEAREDMDALEPFTRWYTRTLWACGQLGVGDEAILAAAKQAGDEPWARQIRFEAIQVLAQGGGGKDGPKVLEAALKDTDGRIRTLAASGIAALAPKTAAEVLGDVVDDRSSLDRLVPVMDAKADKVLREASKSAHTQGVSLPHLVARGDVKGLTELLGDKGLPEVTRLGALEALARIAVDEAQKALIAFANRKEEDEELRKAAWRGLRRARRYAARANREVAS